MTEGHAIAFIGWLKEERVLGRRRVASASVPQYLSAVRTMHKLYVGQPSPALPFLDVVLRAYKKWEEYKFPAAEVWCGVTADIMQKVWHHGMHTDHLKTLRDCSMLAFTFCFNGLRESSVLSLLEQKVWLQGTNAYARCTVWKGREVSKEQVVTFHPNTEVHLPLDIIVR